MSVLRDDMQALLVSRNDVRQTYARWGTLKLRAFKLLTRKGAFYSNYITAGYSGPIRPVGEALGAVLALKIEKLVEAWVI